MKLLLTSNGLSNNSITSALIKLVGKSASETSIAFIPTAMNVTTGDKSWYINDLNNLKKNNFKSVDIVDISALPKKVWLHRLEQVDVLFFSGGNTSHLMRWLKESELDKLLPELLKTRVYAGISAGSIVTNPSLALSNDDKKIYYEEDFNYRSEDALGLVNFFIRPHLNSPSFPHANEEVLKVIAKKLDTPLYGIDDESAIVVNGDEVTVVSEGKYIKL